MSRMGTLSQLDERTWSTISYQELPGRAMTVFFAYAILAWNRFGILGIVEPRAAVRLILVGIYSWIAFTLSVWVASRFGVDGPVEPRDAAVATAIVHVPLVALAMFMAIIAGFARVLGPSLILAIIVVALWMPALLVRSFRDVAGLKWPAAVGAGLFAQLLWVVVTGRYLNDQVGHLL